MGPFNWLWAGRRRGSNPPAPGNKPRPPAGPPEGWADPAKRVTDLAAQAGLSPQDWAKAFNAAGPPKNWIDPAKEKRSAEVAEQLGLSPQDWAEKYSKPQPPGGRLFVNGIEQPRPARREQGFDVERLADRLDELANFVTQGPEAVRRNFTMRVPVEPYHDADRVMSAAASLLRNRPPANHRSLLGLEADFRAWYKNKYGEPYFGAIPITVAIEWGQHLLQQHAPPGEKPEFPPPRKIREGFLP